MTYFLKDFGKKILNIYELKIFLIENIRPLPLSSIKWRPLKVFTKLLESPLLLANIVKGALSDLRVFLFKNHAENEVGRLVPVFFL